MIKTMPWIFLICLASTLPTFAQVGLYLDDDEELLPHQLRLGGDIAHREITVNHPLAPPLSNIREQDGTQLGFVAGYDYIAVDQFYVGLEGRMSDGDGTTSTSDVDNKLTTLEFRLGHTFDVDSIDAFWTTVYVGYGRNTWDRDFKQQTVPDEDYTWEYIALGVRSERMLSEIFSIGFNGKVMFMVEGDFETKLSQTDPTLRDVSVDLGDRIQVELEIPIVYHMNTMSPMDLRIIPYYINTTFDGGDPTPIVGLNGSIAGNFSSVNTDIDIYGVRIEVVKFF